MLKLTHYSNVRKADDHLKAFCNESLIRCYKEYVGSPSGNVLVLDDAKFASTNTITKTFPEFKNLDIWIAQHDEKEFIKMDDQLNTDSHLDKCVSVLIQEDYSALDLHLPEKSVVIDNADFCCGWATVKDTMLNRLAKSKIYANRSILRLTVSARGAKKTMDDFTSDVICDLYRASFDTEYSIKPLSIRQWCSPGSSACSFAEKDKNACLVEQFQLEDLDSTSFTYFPSMVTFIFLITT